MNDKAIKAAAVSAIISAGMAAGVFIISGLIVLAAGIFSVEWDNIGRCLAAGLALIVGLPLGGFGAMVVVEEIYD